MGSGLGRREKRWNIESFFGADARGEFMAANILDGDRCGDQLV